MPATLRRAEVWTILGQFVFPLAARQEIAAAELSRLDGLDEPTPLLADAKAHASALQRQVRRVVISADEAAARTGRFGRHRDKRTLQLGQVGYRRCELEFHFRRDAAPPSLESSDSLLQTRRFASRSAPAGRSRSFHKIFEP